MQRTTQLIGKKIETIGKQAADATREQRFCLFRRVDRVTQYRNIVCRRFGDDFVADQVGGAAGDGLFVADRLALDLRRDTELRVALIEHLERLGDTRVSTTILKDGKRAIGTKMTNQQVLDTVLTQGGTFEAEIKLLGRDYFTVYWPIRDPQGKISGMF